MRQYIRNFNGSKGYTMSSCSAQEQVQQVILVDEHTLIRLALQRIIVTFPRICIISNIRTICDIYSARDIISDCTLILGPSISLVDCFSIVKMLREQQATCGIILIQHNLHLQLIHTLLAQGVHGLLDEHAAEQDLEQALRAAARGHIFLSSRLRTIQANTLPGIAGCLTEREIQVLGRLKYGESNFRIASMLGLKEKTIEKYLTTIYEKLHVHSRAEAMLFLQKSHF